MKRLFVAINLPNPIKWQIDALVGDLENEFDGQVIRWVLKENWHITFSFLGNQSASSIPHISSALQRTTEQHTNIPENVGISFDRICFGPTDKLRRMIWLEAAKESSARIGSLKKDLDAELRRQKIIPSFEKEFTPTPRVVWGFTVHVTLARFSEGASIPNIKFPKIIPISFIPRSLDLMESHLSPAGSEYEILASFSFQKG